MDAATSSGYSGDLVFTPLRILLLGNDSVVGLSEQDRVPVRVQKEHGAHPKGKEEKVPVHKPLKLVRNEGLELARGHVDFVVPPQKGQARHGDDPANAERQEQDVPVLLPQLFREIRLHQEPVTVQEGRAYLGQREPKVQHDPKGAGHELITKEAQARARTRERGGAVSKSA